MIKLIMMWRDNPELGADESRRHYFSQHTEMALATLYDVPGFIRYTQNEVVRHFVHRRNDRTAEDLTPDFDMMIELYFTDEEALQQCFGRPEMDLMFNDHSNFMDADADPSQRVYILKERVILERGIDGTLMVPTTPEAIAFDWDTVRGG